MKPEALNKKAIQIINRVRDKLTGKCILSKIKYCKSNTDIRIMFRFKCLPGTIVFQFCASSSSILFQIILFLNWAEPFNIFGLCNLCSGRQSYLENVEVILINVDQI